MHTDPQFTHAADVSGIGIGQFTEGSQGDAIFFSKRLKKSGEVLVRSFHVS